MEAAKSTHLLVPRDRGTTPSDPRLTPEICLHRSVAYDAHALLSKPSIALDLLGSCIEEIDHLVVVDAALARGLLLPRQLEHFVEGPKDRRQFLQRYSISQSGSPLETVARYHFVTAGFHVQAQYRIEDVGRVDLLVEHAVVVELDGREFHLTPKSFEEDRRRDRELALRGIPVMRFTYSDVTRDPVRMVEQVRHVVARVKRGDFAA